MADLNWLWGALAGGALGFFSAEARERLKHRRSVDGAALDRARELLDAVRMAEAPVRNMTWRLEPAGDARALLPAELPERFRQGWWDIQKRVPDQQLIGFMTNVHENLMQTELEVMRWSRKAPQDREEQFRSFGERFMTAALFSGAALSRIATIERERPRR
jgi:hypothetical protein